jgi:hypothetical protein
LAFVWLPPLRLGFFSLFFVLRLGDLSSSDGPLSYAFIIDSTGRTLMHPNLPLPDAVSSPPVFMDIGNLEVRVRVSVMYSSICWHWHSN